MEKIVVVNNKGYIIVRSRGGRKANKSAPSYRDFWIVKDNNYVGNIHINSITFPKEYIGKRIRLKVEVVENGTSTDN